MKKLFIFLAVLLFLQGIGVLRAYAGNDGKIMDNPFMDSGAPTRYSNGKYYDVAIPYDTKLVDIGGMATGGVSTGKYAVVPLPSDSPKKQIGWMMHESSTLQYQLKKNVKGAVTEGRDKDTDLIYFDVDGVKYYLAALGQGMFSNSQWKDILHWERGMQGVSSNTGLVNKGGIAGYSGILFDIILKDGTQHHFALADTMGVGHSVGDITSNQDSIGYKKSPLKYKQYLCMWYCSDSAHVLEYFGYVGNNAKVMKGLGITESNPIAYVRIWDMSLYKGGIQCKSGQEMYSSNGGSPIDTSSNPNQNTGATGEASVTEANKSSNPQYIGAGYYSESQLGAFVAMNEPDLAGMFLGNVSLDNLNQQQTDSLSNWKRNISNQFDNPFISTLRIFVLFLGILLTLWSGLVYIAYWFDRLNTFFDLSFLSVLTFGKLMVSPDLDSCTFTLKAMGDGKRKTVTHGVIMGISITGLFFGTMLFTGTFYRFIAFIVNLVLTFIDRR